MVNMLVVQRYKQANKNHPNPEVNTEEVFVYLHSGEN